MTSIFLRNAYEADPRHFVKIAVDNNSVIEDIIKSGISRLYPHFSSQYVSYGLYISPHMKWIHPSLTLSQVYRYFDKIPFPISFTLRNYEPTIFTFYCFNYKIRFNCDPNLNAASVASYAASLIKESLPSFFDWKYWALSTLSGDPIDPCHPITDHQKPYLLRREGQPPSENDLTRPIFKSTLTNALHHEKNRGFLPNFIVTLVNAIDKFVGVEGIFRKSGEQTIIEQLSSKIDSMTSEELSDCGDTFAEQNPHNLTGLLKLYIRSLQDPLFPTCFFDILRDNRYIWDASDKPAYFKCLIQSLPTPNYFLLSTIISCLAKVLENQLTNKMSATNLAICIAPCLTKVAGDVLNTQAIMQEFVGELILHYDFYFGNTTQYTIDSKSAVLIAPEGPVTTPNETVTINKQISDDIIEVSFKGSAFQTSVSNIQVDPPTIITTLTDYQVIEHLDDAEPDFLIVKGEGCQSIAEHAARLKDKNDTLSQLIEQVPNTDDERRKLIEELQHFE